VLQWMATIALAFLDEAFEPGCLIGDDLLKLRRGKPLLPIVTAEKEQVIGFLCWCAHSVFLVAGLDSVQKKNERATGKESKAELFYSVLYSLNFGSAGFM
jgi:hypothetical protein